MLEAFEIFTTSGVVLWSRNNTNLSASAVNSLINDVFIEEKSRSVAQTSSFPSFQWEKYTLKYTLVKDLGLIFVVRLIELLLQALLTIARLSISRCSIYHGLTNSSSKSSLSLCSTIANNSRRERRSASMTLIVIMTSCFFAKIRLPTAMRQEPLLEQRLRKRRQIRK